MHGSWHNLTSNCGQVFLCGSTAGGANGGTEGIIGECLGGGQLQSEHPFESLTSWQRPLVSHSGSGGQIWRTQAARQSSIEAKLFP